jgi:hypothetical protein
MILKIIQTFLELDKKLTYGCLDPYHTRTCIDLSEQISVFETTSVPLDYTLDMMIGAAKRNKTRCLR